jgi:hypothetical protein
MLLHFSIRILSSECPLDLSALGITPLLPGIHLIHLNSIQSSTCGMSCATRIFLTAYLTVSARSNLI